MERAVQHQKLWRSSIDWLRLITHPENIVAQAKDAIKRLPWNKPLGSGATTLDFAGFLGASWLSDTQINMMVNVLQKRVGIEELTERALIEPIEFTWELEFVGAGSTDPQVSPYLLRVVDQVQDGITAIWFPVNVGGCHWIAGRVDFETWTFEFGKP